jgi:RNase H-fold protein (predicted Holliday junction resolvase)
LTAKTEDINRYTMEYLQKIESFAKKYDVLVFIVAHPTKMYKDKDGKIEEPTMYRLKVAVNGMMLVITVYWFIEL